MVTGNLKLSYKAQLGSIIYSTLTLGILEGEEKARGRIGVDHFGQEALEGRHDVIGDWLQVGTPALGLSIRGYMVK